MSTLTHPPAASGYTWFKSISLPAFVRQFGVRGSSPPPMSPDGTCVASDASSFLHLSTPLPPCILPSLAATWPCLWACWLTRCTLNRAGLRGGEEGRWRLLWVIIQSNVVSDNPRLYNDPRGDHTQTITSHIGVGFTCGPQKLNCERRWKERAAPFILMNCLCLSNSVFRTHAKSHTWTVFFSIVSCLTKKRD